MNLKGYFYHKFGVELDKSAHFLRLYCIHQQVKRKLKEKGCMFMAFLKACCTCRWSSGLACPRAWWRGTERWVYDVWQWVWGIWLCRSHTRKGGLWNCTRMCASGKWCWDKKGTGWDEKLLDEINYFFTIFLAMNPIGLLTEILNCDKFACVHKDDDVFNNLLV